MKNTTKICSKCGNNKLLSKFNKFSKSKDNYYPSCKSCRKKHYIEYKDTQSIYAKQYYKENIEHIREYKTQNKDTISVYNKIYKLKHRKRINTQKKHRMLNDPLFKLSQTLRTRISDAIRLQYGTKAYKSMELLGCSIDIARFHLECQFTEGMTWENHSTHGWHIDHIRPCASYDLTNPDQQKECFHYTNLQPLWAKDNLSKGDKY